MTLEFHRSRPKIDDSTSTGRRKKKPMNVGMKFSTKPKCRRQEPEKGGRKLQTNQNEETSSRRRKPTDWEEWIFLNQSINVVLLRESNKRQQSAISQWNSNQRNDEECEILSRNHQWIQKPKIQPGQETINFDVMDWRLCPRRNAYVFTVCVWSCVQEANKEYSKTNLY